MGTRFLGYIDYPMREHVERFPDEMLGILETTTLACQAVEEYWRLNDPSYMAGRFHAWGVWENRKRNRIVDRWWFRGPGSISIRFCSNVAVIHAGARWRGFLTLPPLREVHRAAFLAIARAVGATGVLFVPDDADELFDVAVEGKSLEECLTFIEQQWGPMQGDLDEIQPAVITACEHRPPKVWYLQPT